MAVLLLLGWLASVSVAPPAGALGSSEPPPLPSVSAGGYMTCAVDASGNASCWGENGVPSNDRANTSPGGQATPPTPGLQFLEVNAGYATACGITTTNTISCWGSGRYDKFIVPSGTFTHVVPALNYICALRTDGTVTCWGGEDSDPLATVANNEPTGQFTQVTVGNRHACALRADGTIACWGTNADGQLNVPAGTFKYVNVSNFTSCALRTDGTPVCWGRNQGGQQTYPAGTFTQISTGFAHVCGLRADQTVTCWGRNSENQTVVPAGTYTHVSAGTFHTCAMPTSGPPARCWGNNAAGRVQPNMSPIAPHQGFVANPYSFQLTMTTHVFPAPTYTLASGGLPPGLTLSPTGQISGTPTAAGSYTFTVAASSLGLSPPDCSTAFAVGDSQPCTPGNPTSASNVTATRTFTIVIGAVAPAPGTVTGTVTAAGVPVAGATVTATHSGGAPAGSTTANANGTYTLSGLLPGTYNVTASGPELQPLTKPAVVTENGTTTVDFALVPLIRPTVVAVSTNHYDTVTDGVFVEWSEQFEQRLETPSNYTIHTAAGCAGPAIATAWRGNWLEIRPTIRDLEMTGWENVVPGGTYWLRVAPETEFGFTTLQRNALQCVQFVADLRPADEAVLVGRVTDANRMPIAGATITVTRTVGEPGTVAGQATTSANGEYRIDNLAPGSYQVTLNVPGQPPQTTNVTLVGGTTYTLNFGPVDAVNDAYTTAEDVRLTVPAQGVLANDVGGPLIAALVGTPSSGTVTVSPDGSFVYTPAANFNGTATFTYSARVAGGVPDTATVTITVTPVNDPPNANTNDTYTTAEDTTLTVPAPGVLANDTDIDSATLTATSASDPPHGTVFLNTNGSFIYIPDANYSGPDSFTYVINDGSGGTRTATVNITVTAVNDGPVAVDDAYSTAEDTPLTVPVAGVLANDTDTEPGALTAGTASDPANGSVVLNPNGSFTYTPDANFNGIDTFTYVATDTASGTDSATVTITVTAVNDAPVAVDDIFTTVEGAPQTLAVLANDSDVEGSPLTIVTVVDPPHGSVVTNANGTITYTPDTGYNGPDSFTYTVSDGAATDTAQVNINVVRTDGYRMVAADGGVFTFGDAGFYGSTGGVQLDAPIVGMASTPSEQGYWLVAEDGGIFAFGDAGFFGSTGGIPLDEPIIAMEATPSGRGYWLVALDGGIFAFGDAGFYGSTGGVALPAPIIGMAATPTGQGYWLVDLDGGVYPFGDARSFGSLAGIPLDEPILGIEATPSGNGYWLVALDGGIFAFGDAGFFGSTGGIPLDAPVIGMARTESGNGYWLVAEDGGIFTFGDAQFLGSTGGVPLVEPIVGMTGPA